MKTCVVVLDNIRSVENTGSVFRTAEGLGVSKIYLVGTTPAPIDRFGRKRGDFAKVSLGAEDLIEWEHVKGVEEALTTLKEQGFKIISLEQDPRSVSVASCPKPLEPFALIVGNEVEGVSKMALDMSDEVVEIEMKGEKESLNVSVAAGIALFNLLS